MKSFKELRGTIKEKYWDSTGSGEGKMPSNAKMVQKIKLPRQVDGDSITFYDDGKNTYAEIQGSSQNAGTFKFGKKYSRADFAKIVKELEDLS